MSEQEEMLVNPNSASAEALIQLPGVGEVLAQRIIASRPYTQIEDMIRVPGLGENTLTRLKAYLTFEEEISPALEVPADKEVESETLRPARRKPIREKVTYSREATLWMIVGAVVVSVALSVLLSLSILAGINRTLNYGRHDTVRQLSSELAEIKAEITDISSGIDVIGRRIEAVEGLSGRVTGIENEFSAVREEVRRTLGQLDSIRSRMDGLMQEMMFLSERVGIFDAFLDGLRELLVRGLPATAP
ncbi:MAG: helix-hairpin-helix domain-containing protein [Anaerolineaceae bacterium]|nr:MAG: helix-hairpin-helix domain-containing protein [Anaerolineaceae bacterium]